MDTGDRAAARTDTQAPHELLGVAADERNPARIVEAAAARLRAVHDGGGTDLDVRRTVVALIRRARDAMLRAARG